MAAITTVVDVSDAIEAALAAEGYLNANGTKDVSKVVSLIVGHLEPRKVLHKREREEKAIARAELVSLMFPHSPSLAEIEEIADDVERVFAQELYKKLSEFLWGLTGTDARGKVQIAVGSQMGNGYVLCKAKIGGSGTPNSIYITDNLDCLRADYTQPLNDKFMRETLRDTENRELLAMRQPHNAKSFANEQERMIKNALTTAKNKLQLTVDSVTNTNVTQDEEENAA